MRRVLVPILVSTIAACSGPASDPSEPLVPYLHWESSSVQANGLRLHYWRTGGEGKPVIVMAHGITDYGLNWATLASRLEDDYDIVMYDARGHGFSEKPSGPYDLASHVEDLVALVRALGIEKPILVGHSMGGSTVGLAAATYPDLPAAVIMEDPPMDEALDHLTVDILDDWKEQVRRDQHRSKAELTKRARTEFHPGWSDFEYDHWAESKRLVVPEVVDILRGDGFGDPRAIFPSITAPTLILKSDADEDARARHRETASRLPRGELIHVDGAGHLIRNDRPDVAEREIRDFLGALASER